MFGGSVVDHYRRRLADTDGMPDHSLPPEEAKTDG